MIKWFLLLLTLLFSLSGPAMGGYSDFWQSSFTAKFGAYGPLPTSRMLTLESGASLAQATAWRGNRLDPTGFIQLGVRPYDPAAGRFLSADPLGHGASMSLYCFANGDPVNFHDPDGYLAVGAWNLTTRVLGNTYVSGSLRTVGGVAQAGAGFAFAAGTSWTGVGAVGGVAVGLHGIDQAVAGIHTISSGQYQSSFTSMGIQRTGVSQSYADLIDGGVSIVGSGGIGLASRVSTTAPTVTRAPAVVALPPKTITTPHGPAVQAMTAEAQAALRQVQSGATVYRQGWTGTQRTLDAQNWALQNPATTPNFARQLGMPATATEGEYFWMMGGRVTPGAPVITRPAPGIGGNVGGSMEAVVNPGGVRIDWFHMPD